MGEVAVNGSNTPPTPTTDTVTIITQPEDTTAYVGGEFDFHTVADTDDATATLSYQWQIYADSTWTDISGATSSTYVGTAPETTGTADYRCVVNSTGGGTATSDSATLTVEAIPIDTVTITTQPQSATGFIGDTITLSVVAESDDETATLSYQWQVKDGSTYTDISGATSSTYTVNTSTVGTERYRVVVTSDKGGTATSNYADVTVTTDTVTITTQPSSTTVYVDEPVTLSVTAVSNSQTAVLSYQWQQFDGYSSWDNLPYETSYTYSPDTSTTGNQAYRCVITSSLGGTATTDGADVFVENEPMPDYIDWLDSLEPTYTVSQGSSLTLYAEAQSGWGWTVEYQWQKYINSTWTDISGATSYIYVVDTSTAGSVEYRCVATDGNVTDTQSCTVTVTLPTDTITASIDTASTTATAYSSGYNLPTVANSKYYAVSASSNLGKTISYSWSWQNASGYTSVVQLSGRTTNRVQLTLTSSDAPNNALAGQLICYMTTPDSDTGYGATRTLSISCFR